MTNRFTAQLGLESGRCSRSSDASGSGPRFQGCTPTCSSITLRRGQLGRDLGAASFRTCWTFGFRRGQGSKEVSLVRAGLVCQGTLSPSSAMGHSISSQWSEQLASAACTSAIPVARYQIVVDDRRAWTSRGNREVGGVQGLTLAHSHNVGVGVANAL